MNMPKLLSFFATVLMTLSLGAKAAERINVEHDARIVSDTGSLDFVAISARTDQNWIVAEVVPDHRDGFFEGVKQDGETGMYTQVSGTSVTQVHQGTIRLIAPITGLLQPQSWNYKWHLPAEIYRNYLISNSSTADPYLAFYQDDVIVCRVNDGSQAEAENLFNSKFYPLYLIPVQWENSIMPALKYFYKNAAMFRSSNVDSDTDQLWKLTEDQNPVIAAQALRSLFQGSQIKSPRLFKLLTNMTGLKQAVFTFEVLGRCPQQPFPMSNQTTSSLTIQKPVLDSISEVIRNAKSAEELEGLAWGIWSAEVAPISRRGREGTAKIARIALLESLLEKIQQRQNAIRGYTEEDVRLNAWLRAANVPQKP